MSPLAANLALSDRDAILDALYRSIIGLDTADKAMFESAWHKDATFAFDETTPVQGLDAILGSTFKYIGEALDTTHCVSNTRIDVKDGATTAVVTAHALAHHYRKGEGRNPTASGFLTGNTYSIDLSKDQGDGLWKMTRFHLQMRWCEGDPSIVGQ